MLSLLAQPLILRKETEQSNEPKSKHQEVWLFRVAFLVGAAVGSQLALLAEVYEQRLGGFISGSYDALKRSYAAYCGEEQAQQRTPAKELLDPFVCNSWLPCEKVPLFKVREIKDELTQLFRAAEKERPFETAARIGQAHVWYKRVWLQEQLRESGYTKPIYVLMGADLPLLKESAQNFQPRFPNSMSGLIYGVAGGALAIGIVYASINTARWLHEALVVQPAEKKKVAFNPQG